MQIIIELPNSKVIKADNLTDFEEYCIMLAVQNRIPLSKGHCDLIDMNKIIHTTVYNDQYDEWVSKEMTILDFINAYTDEGITEAMKRNKMERK